MRFSKLPRRVFVAAFLAAGAFPLLAQDEVEPCIITTVCIRKSVKLFGLITIISSVQCETSTVCVP